MCTAKVLEEYENCKDISKPVKNLGIQVTRCDKDELIKEMIKPINDRKSTFLIVYLNDEQKAKTKRKGSSHCIYVKNIILDEEDNSYIAKCINSYLRDPKPFIKLDKPGNTFFKVNCNQAGDQADHVDNQAGAVQG